MLSKEKINQIRAFNRDYVIMLGILNKPKYDSNLSWPERRLMIEIGVNHLKTPMALAQKLNLDKSYTSRLINNLVRKGLLVKRRSELDLRSVELFFTKLGQKVFAEIDQLSVALIQRQLAKLGDAEQEQLFNCLKTADRLLFERQK